MVTAKPPSLWIRLDLRPRGQVGPGKIELLRKVQETRSISAAARALDMSYRRAWMLLDQMNKTFREPVVQTSIGGRERGGAAPTPFGAELIALYDAVAAKSAAAAAEELAALQRMAATDDAAEPPSA
ncbi:MAG: winged helix-turn-helix domain-containing protein [Hyphomicrobiales bacterium]|nr:winged helix-turn-helix domain-containing protein [Hyphomicrobiales bacterium]